MVELPTVHRVGPRRVGALGVALWACAFLPLTPQGRTFVRVVIDAFGEGVLFGSIILVGYGSPFIFGLTTALGVWWSNEVQAAALVRGPVIMMHSQLLLVSWLLFRYSEAIASWPLLLFALVSGLYTVQYSAGERAAGRMVSFRWYVRMGALVVVTVAAWLWMQRWAGLAMGPALYASGLCALLLLVWAYPSRVRPAA